MIPLMQESLLTLNPDQQDVTAACLDSRRGYAYLATYTVPAVLIKIRTTDMVQEAALTLNAGEGPIAGVVYDQVNNTAYFTTTTAPSQIIKVNLDTFTRVGKLTLLAGEDDILTGFIDPGNNTAYFGLATSPGALIQVNLNTFTRVANIPMGEGNSSISAVLLDPSVGRAYVGTLGGKVFYFDTTAAVVTRTLYLPNLDNAIINIIHDKDANRLFLLILSDAVRVMQVSTVTGMVQQVLNFSAEVGGEAIEILPDISTNQFFRLGDVLYTTLGTSPGMIVRARISDFRVLDSYKINTDDAAPGYTLWEPDKGKLFVATKGNPAQLVRVDLGLFGRIHMPTGVPISVSTQRWKAKTPRDLRAKELPKNAANSTTNRKTMISPRLYRGSLYFRNGRYPPSGTLPPGPGF
jgi:hypothetical protein